MIPRGKRLPAGGLLADTYRYYNDQQADAAENPRMHLQTLFDHALVRPTLSIYIIN